MQLRCTLVLSTDYLSAVTREFLVNAVSHSSLDQCLCRQGLGNLKLLKLKTPIESLKVFRAISWRPVNGREKVPKMVVDTHKSYMVIVSDRVVK